MNDVNDCIRCSVSTCAYHDAIAQHCTLKSIKVGCSQAKPKSCESTQCASFQQRSLF
jgi:hypothetical protein